MAGNDLVADFARASVRSGNNNSIAKTDFAVFFVAEDTLVEDLEQSSEDGRMGFFDFVEQNHSERLFHNLGGETESIRSAVANETGDVVNGDEFVHVEANDVVFAVKVNFGKSFGEFGFTDTSGAEKEEGADGAVAIANAGAGATQSISDA